MPVPTPTPTPTLGGIHIVGADNLAQSDAGRAIITFGRDLQTEYEGPTGRTIEITENGNYDVQNYDEAEVNVSGGVTPTGTITLQQNGTFDVTDFARAIVNVPTPTPVPPRTIFIANRQAQGVIYYNVEADGNNLVYHVKGTIANGSSTPVQLPNFSAGGASGPYPLVLRVPSGTALKFSGDAHVFTVGYQEVGTIRRYVVLVKTNGYDNAVLDVDADE